MATLRERLLEAVWQSRGRIVGVLTALFLSWVFLAYGFWRALVVFALLVIGYIVGARADAGLDPLPEAFRRYLERSR